jgi:hypothetical protein
LFELRRAESGSGGAESGIFADFAWLMKQDENNFSDVRFLVGDRCALE